MSIEPTALPFHTSVSGSELPTITLSLDQTANHSFANHRDSHRPTPLRIHSTPPASPTEPHKMATTPPLHPSGALTPPETPAALRYNKLAHSAPFAAASPDRSMAKESVPSTSLSLSPEKSSESDYMTFTDYEIIRTERLGSGYWSDVYAGRCKVTSELQARDPFVQDMPTPPSTPSKQANPDSWPSAQRIYAVKVPAQRTANDVLFHEAKALNHLRSRPGSAPYIVPFHGFDPRTNAIVLGLLPQSLEDYVLHTLASLPEQTRTTTLASAMPSLSHHLIAGLEFLHGSGVVHADIKPSNILLGKFHSHYSSESATTIPVYADFSSSIIAPDPAAELSGPEHQAPLGGGSWDFLSPNLVKLDPKTGDSPDPTAADDVYALAITLLYTIIGRSPYAAQGKNVFQRREMVKQGRAVEFATDDTKNAERLKGLTRAVHLQKSADGKTVGDHGFSSRSFLNLGLKKKAEDRVTASQWKKWLDEHGVSEPEVLDDWCKFCEHAHGCESRKDSVPSSHHFVLHGAGSSTF